MRDAWSCSRLPTVGNMDVGNSFTKPLTKYQAISGPYLAVLEQGCRMIYAGFPSFFGLGLEGGHVSTSWLLL